MIGSTKTEWDVVVVGAGPAGSVAARQAANAGFRTLLVDQATFPRPKVCGCCLTAIGWEMLRKNGFTARIESSQVSQIESTRFYLQNQYCEVPTQGIVISREILDWILIEEAQRSGVEFKSGTRVTLTSERGLRLESGTETTVVSPTMIVAADGLNGTIAARLANEKPVIATDSYIGAGLALPTSDRIPAGRIDMYSGAGGYVGMVKLPDGRIDVAAALSTDSVREIGIAETARAIVREASGESWPDLSGHWRGTPTLTRRPARVVGLGWLALGDAAGYVEPFTGEGMTWAIASGLASTEALIAAQHGQPFGWAARLRSLVGPRRLVCQSLTSGLRSPAFSASAFRVMRLFPWLAPHVMAMGQGPMRDLLSPRLL
jgi:menaquinone-9 beta-reductase